MPDWQTQQQQWVKSTAYLLACAWTRLVAPEPVSNLFRLTLWVKSEGAGELITEHTTPLLYPGSLAPRAKPISRSAISWPEQTYRTIHKTGTSTEQAEFCVLETQFYDSFHGKIWFFFKAFFPPFIQFKHQPVLMKIDTSFLSVVRHSQTSPLLKHNNQTENFKPMNHQWLHTCRWWRSYVLSGKRTENTQVLQEVRNAKLIIAHNYESSIYPGWSYVTTMEVSLFGRQFKAHERLARLPRAITLIWVVLCPTYISRIEVIEFSPTLKSLIFLTFLPLSGPDCFRYL